MAEGVRSISSSPPAGYADFAFQVIMNNSRRDRCAASKYCTALDLVHYEARLIVTTCVCISFWLLSRAYTEWRFAPSCEINPVMQTTQRPETLPGPSNFVVSNNDNGELLLKELRGFTGESDKGFECFSYVW